MDRIDTFRANLQNASNLSGLSLVTPLETVVHQVRRYPETETPAVLVVRVGAGWVRLEVTLNDKIDVVCTDNTTRTLADMRALVQFIETLSN